MLHGFTLIRLAAVDYLHAEELLLCERKRRGERLLNLIPMRCRERGVHRVAA
jgi:hypothetical protein